VDKGMDNDTAVAHTLAHTPPTAGRSALLAPLRGALFHDFKIFSASQERQQSRAEPMLRRAYFALSLRALRTEREGKCRKAALCQEGTLHLFSVNLALVLD